MDCSQENASLKGKRILFIAATFFNIPAQIIASLESKGAIVDFFDERPSNSFLTKSLIRINRNLLSYRVNRYYDRIIAETAQRHYDYIFFIKGECVSVKSLKKLREMHPDARFILYQWDAVSYNKHFYTIRPYFDRVLSFDPVDCENLNLEFLPLFYDDAIKMVNEGSRGEKMYDLMFVGTIHSDRYRILNAISSQVEKMGGRVFMYMFMQSKKMYYVNRYLKRSIGKAPKETFKYHALDSAKLAEVYEKSRIIVDVERPSQRGLTIRTFETLGARKKLITTNKNIKNYDFYNPRNILVIDRENPVVPDDFLKGDYTQVPDEIYNKYSVGAWTDLIFKTSTDKS